MIKPFHILLIALFLLWLNSGKYQTVAIDKNQDVLVQYVVNGRINCLIRTSENAIELCRRVK